MLSNAASAQRPHSRAIIHAGRASVVIARICTSTLHPAKFCGSGPGNAYLILQERLKLVLRNNFKISAKSCPAGIEGGEEVNEQLVLGHSRAMKPLRERIAAVASSSVPVFISGENGSGKEVFARLIHRLSVDRTDPFVKKDCATASADAFENYLEPMSSGAQVAPSPAATVFLDEITELDAPTQLKLLQLLQQGGFCQNGARESNPVGPRLICASARNLDLEVANGNFQQDLYYRISVITLRLPPLRERIEDIPVLTQHFVNSFNARFGCEAEHISETLMKSLCEYEWPGNIRQLGTLIKRYVILGSQDVIAAELNSKQEGQQLFARIPDIAQGESISLKSITKDMVRSFERHIITKVLEANHWNRAEAARALNISYRSLLYKVKSAQLSNRPHSSMEQS